MKILFSGQRSKRIAFTLIELLVVVAIIAILAGLLTVGAGRISDSRMKTVARSELTQVATAIEAYKAKYGFYPPDGTNALYSPLFYELSGAVLTNDATRGANPAGDSFGFLTLDKRVWSLTNAFPGGVGVGGIANSSSNPKGTDERPGPVSFLKEIKPTQFGTNKGVILLVCSQVWSRPGGTESNPWRYVSSNPTNNPGSYDLWVDLYINGKTNRISNWSKQPIVW